MGNTKPKMEGQTTQWPKEKGKKKTNNDLQKAKDRATRKRTESQFYYTHYDVYFPVISFPFLT